VNRDLFYTIAIVGLAAFGVGIDVGANLVASKPAHAQTTLPPTKVSHPIDVDKPRWSEFTCVDIKERDDDIPELDVWACGRWLLP
jgi:hypothetical protein